MAKRILSLDTWGLWDAPLASAYRRDVSAAIDQLSGGPWSVLAENSRFPAQKPEVQAAIQSLMEYALQHGMRRSATISGISTTRMQIQRLATQSGIVEISFHPNKAAALRWLAEKSESQD